MIGKTIAHYEIVDMLGKGGMGEVYRARDTKLDREVALKVLPPELADNTERMARLQREAKVLASLNHPNIAAIHGLEEVDGKVILVMELAAGDELASVIQGGMPQEQALELARQMAEGLEEAHAKSIVHRDLKPANIKVSPDGKVKILDFGLARAFVNEAEPEIDSALSPTITGMHTMAGTIIGTAAYMSPEQARGLTVDKRADIFAFGAVLYEMLTGRQLFDGSTVSDKLAAILKSDPDWDLLPADTSPRLRELLERCLAKQRRARLQDIGDGRIEIEKIQAGDTGYAPAEAHSHRRGLPFVPALVGLILLPAIVGFGAWFLADSGDEASFDGGTAQHMSIDIPTELRLISYLVGPEGTMALAAVPTRPETPEDKVVRLYLRRLDGFEFEPVPGSESVRGYCFSPDGQWLALVAPEKSVAGTVHLWKVPTDFRSSPLMIQPWPDSWGVARLHWMASGDLVASTGTQGLMRIPMDGKPAGEPVKMEATAGEFQFVPEESWASALPDGDHLLASIETWNEDGYAQNIHVANVNTGEVKLVMENGSNPRWLDTGHLMFSRGNSILAIGFDPVTLEVQGGLIALTDGLRIQAAWAHGGFALSRTGHLFFRPGGLVGQQQTLAFTDRNFHATTPWSEDNFAFDQAPLVSPDGRFVAAVIASPKGTFETWVSRLDRPGFRRFALDKGRDVTAQVWANDGSSLVMRSFYPGSNQILAKDSAGSSEARLIYGLENSRSFVVPTDLADQDQTLLLTRITDGVGSIETIPFHSDGDIEPTVLIENAQSGKISPDGMWLTYESNSGGQTRLQVRRWLGEGRMGPEYQVSSEDAIIPRWYQAGPGAPLEIWYGHESGMRSVVMNTRPEPTFSKPQQVAEAEDIQKGFDILPDGRILTRLAGPDEVPPGRLDVILNWENEVREKMRAR